MSGYQLTIPDSPPHRGDMAKHITSEPENPFAKLISNQKIIVIPSFTLESGVTIHEVPVAYKTSGRLNENADNAMLICHALTGSADVEDWWGPLVGPGRAFDWGRFFVVCCNSLGSPYGSASPCTMNLETGRIYGPEFPLTTVRDDVNIHKIVLDYLGVKSIAVAIGGSMGGMLVLEWAYFGKEYVRSIVALATITAEGYYPFDDPPTAGLGAARMSALLTYRSRNSFESRFGRNTPDPTRHPYINSQANRPPSTPSEEHWAVHNEGFRNARRLVSSPSSPITETFPRSQEISISNNTTPSPPAGVPVKKNVPTYFSAQSYLRYQGDKFVKRFDANCYIAITRKLDTHDVSRGRTNGDIHAALRMIHQPALIIGIESDGLFTYAEQQQLAEAIPDARLATIDSPEGHDAFLLQFEEVNTHIVGFLWDVMPDVMAREPICAADKIGNGKIGAVNAGTVGEVDDITAW
ncbi:homoserine O-acetyltransferase [Choiromyces venosus 120613-1]|uniref:Homoserine O-acetyltransferase n=1 Tax=Choiromyces venosus 120613-1 TaxID=1336337 RepID=A0A3N4IUC0_9PEZI|nr:homoserine O-acetyltransferase [Choiromyces venosus 120613-1]